MGGSDAPPMSVTAVIAAAGSGERLGAGGPKAFVQVAGRPMVEWSIAAFRAAGAAAIVVAVPPEVAAGNTPAGLSSSPVPGAVQVGPGDRSAVAGDDSGGERVSAPTVVVAGGATRAESVSNALEAVETELVAIHDAARPLVTPELIEGVVATLAADPEAAGAIAAAPVTDTIKRTANRTKRQSSPSGRPNWHFVEETVDRDELWAAQTPQVFRTDALRAAISAASVELLAAATDEAMVLEAAGERVLLHPSSPQNLKVTTPFDLQVVEARLSA